MKINKCLTIVSTGRALWPWKSRSTGWSTRSRGSRTSWRSSESWSSWWSLSSRPRTAWNSYRPQRSWLLTTANLRQKLHESANRLAPYIIITYW